MSTHTDYIEMMEANMKKWDAEVDDLRNRGKQLATEMRADYFNQLKELRVHREAAQKKFQEFRGASEEAASKLHAGMEGAWQSMKSGLDRMSNNATK